MQYAVVRLPTLPGLVLGLVREKHPALDGGENCTQIRSIQLH